jgi:SAM-dependent methyltransferase
MRASPTALRWPRPAPTRLIGECLMPQLVADEAPDVQEVQFSWAERRSQGSDLRLVLDTVNNRHRRVYDALADEYYRKSFAHRPTTQDRVKYVVAEYVKPGGAILDVGCGVGLALSMLSQHEKGLDATGIDLSPTMVGLAKKRSPRTPVIVGDFLTADVKTTYDAIWEQALLHLFPSMLEDCIFERFRTLLNPGGILSLSTTVATVSQEGWEVKKDYGTAPMRYRRSITAAELKRALAEYGFTLVDRWVTTDPFGKNWLTVVGEKQ